MCVSPPRRVQYCESECQRRSRTGATQTRTAIHARRPTRRPPLCVLPAVSCSTLFTMHHQKQQHQKQQEEASCRHLQWRLSGIVFCVLLAASLVASAASSPLDAHHLAKRSFFDIQCKGVYDKSIFARLDRICEDCYNLFREPQLHSLCRKDCFTSDYFKGCIDVLLLQDDMDKIQSWIKQIHGAEPGV